MVKMAPETATAAELRNMEQDLDAAGQLISRLRRELTDERHAYDAINTRYTQMMGAAENLQHQIDTASFLKDPYAHEPGSAKSLRQTEERDISIGEAGDVSIGDLHKNGRITVDSEKFTPLQSETAAAFKL